MIVLDYFGQQLEWVWAIVFVHGPYRPEESFIQFWAKLQQWIMMMIFFSTVTKGSSTINQMSVITNSLVPNCQFWIGGVKLSNCAKMSAAKLSRGHDKGHRWYDTRRCIYDRRNYWSEVAVKSDLSLELCLLNHYIYEIYQESHFLSISFELSPCPQSLYSKIYQKWYFLNIFLELSLHSQWRSESTLLALIWIEGVWAGDPGGYWEVLS